LTGATGPQGAQGSTGLTGATGPQGPIGLTGPQGLIGATGPQGEQGPIGLTGPAGPQGLAGSIGPQGEQGSIGLIGPAGPQGLTGAQGSQGPQGSTGPQGPIGLTGPTGATGANGKNSLIKTANEPAGATCETGGVKMEYGIDANSNGILDLNEVNNTLTKYVCNGLQGDPATDDQQLSVSISGDTLFLQGGGYAIIQGISSDNNSIGQIGITDHSCGAPLVHNPRSTYNVVSDIDGNFYKTIKIGDQIWMAENLKSKHFNNGDIIPNVFGDDEWASLTTPGWCSPEAFNYDVYFECPQGILYNGFVVRETQLTSYLGGVNVAAPKMRSYFSLYWTGITGGISTNSSGFSGLPLGTRQINGVVLLSSQGASFWSSTSFSAVGQNFIYLGNGQAVSGSAYDNKTGCSIRCIMD
jgi:uncharacterized protein (TIGR02145 family)